MVGDDIVVEVVELVVLELEIMWEFAGAIAGSWKVVIWL